MSKTKVKSKKISFISTVLLVIGSTLGAGIFFKNKEVLGNNNGSLILACVSWGIAIIGVLAMGLTLSELASGSKQNNKEGIIGWVKTFNSNYLYKAARCFMTWIYSPLSFFFLPYYVLLSIQDGVWLATNGSYTIPYWVIILCAFLTMIWLALSAGFSVKVAHVQNWIITAIKFFPVVIVIILGFTIFGVGGWKPEVAPAGNDPPKLFTDFSPLFGVIASVPAIFFAFDGFYTVSSNTSEMKEPKKASMAMALGLAILSFIDVIITLAMLFGTKDGSVSSMTDWLNEHGSWKWLGVALNIMIGIGVMGILNGFALFDSFYYGALIKIGELPLSSRLKKYRINFGGTIYKTICAIIAFSLFTLIGCFYLKGGYEGAKEFDGVSQRLYCFVDTMANWTALLSFGCITIAVIGGLINRRTKRVKVKKSKLFIPAAIISVAIVCLGALYIVTEQIANVVITARYYADDTLALYEGLMPTIISLCVLILFILIMFVYPIFEIRKNKKRSLLLDTTIV